MFLRLFKGAGPGVLVLIIITLLAIWTGAFLNPVTDSISEYNKTPMPLYELLKMIIGNKALTGVVFSFLLVSVMAFLIVNFNTKEVFISERTFLPALFYVLAIGLFPQFQLFNPVLPASLFLLFALIRIIDSYHKPGIAYNFFDAGILISTGSLFYANLIWFGILIFIGIALLRPGNLIEITVSFFGLLTPYLLAFGLFYTIGKGAGALMMLLKINLFGNSTGYIIHGFTLVALISVSVVVIVSITYLLMRISSKKIKSRVTFNLLLWVFIISLCIYIFLPSGSVDIIWIISIPASYFLAHYFVFIKKKVIPEIIFLLLFMFVLVIQILYLK
jgi:Family of unknown function (DUF6427)